MYGAARRCLPRGVRRALLCGRRRRVGGRAGCGRAEGGGVRRVHSRAGAVRLGLCPHERLGTRLRLRRPRLRAQPIPLRLRSPLRRRRRHRRCILFLLLVAVVAFLVLVLLFHVRRLRL